MQKSKEKIHAQCEHFGGILGDVFTDVMKGNNLMVADDWHS